MNTELTDIEQIKKVKRLILTLSIVIPLAVAILFKVHIHGLDLSVLPAIYATINGLTAITLILAVRAIKNGNRARHRQYIRVSLLLSVLFLVMYVLYHMTSSSTLYGDTNHSGSIDILERAKLGVISYVYYLLLITHIVLSIAVVPLVLYTYLWAWMGSYEKHKRWTRFAFPIWLYVAVSGVLVYLMISPYYA
jgi:putative membrane protein